MSVLVDGIKAAIDVARKADNVDLLKDLIDVYERAVALQEENAELRARVQELERIRNLEDQLDFRDNSYWLDDDGPFCSLCWDDRQRLVRKHSGYVGGRMLCPKCELKH